MYQELSLENVFKKIDIPDFSKEQEYQEHKKAPFPTQQTTFMLFKVGDMHFAIDDSLIHSLGFTKNIIQAQEQSNEELIGIYKNHPVKFVDLAKVFDLKGERNAFFLTQHKNQELAFFFEDIIGLQAVAHSAISHEARNAHFSGYFLLHDTLVSILSPRFIHTMITKKGLTISSHNIHEQKATFAMHDFLVVEISGHKYAIAIAYIIGVLDYMKTEIQKRPGSMGTGNLILYKNRTVDLLTWEKVGKTFTPTIDAKIVILQQSANNYVAIAVDRIEDIITVPENKIAHLPNTNAMSAGVIIAEKEKYNIFNIQWQAFGY